MRKEVIVAGCALIGAGFGFNNQNNDRNDARENVTTIEACTQSVSFGRVVNAALETCLEKGTPGGAALSSEDIYQGEPIELIESYRQSQEEVADNIDAGEIVKGAAIGGVIGIVLI